MWDKGERLVDAKIKKTIFNLALQSEASIVKKQAAHQTRKAQKYQPQNVQWYRSRLEVQLLRICGPCETVLGRD